MDFTLDEAQEELRGLAAELLGREAAPDRLEAHERSGEPYDAGLWRVLARAGLLGAVLPEEAGGAGLGPVELAVILREVGAHVAPSRPAEPGRRDDRRPVRLGRAAPGAGPAGRGGARAERGARG
ncbi:acyl-CoA dehydrogenase family protein, partial [Planomonospora algeriensis]